MDTYDRSRQRYLYYKKSADNDGATNLEEWQAADTGDFYLDLETFAQNATNALPPDTGGAKTVMKDGGGSCDCGCDDPEALGTATVTLIRPNPADYAGSDLHGTLTCNPSVVLGSDPLTVPLGTEVVLTAEMNSDAGWEFGWWWALDSTANWSPIEKGEKFRVMEDTVISAVFFQRRLEVMADDDQRAITVIPTGGASVTTDEWGRRIVVGPPAGRATLTARAKLPDDRVLGWALKWSSGASDEWTSYSTKATLGLLAAFQGALVQLDLEVGFTPIETSMQQGTSC